MQQSGPVKIAAIDVLSRANWNQHTQAALRVLFANAHSVKLFSGEQTACTCRLVRCLMLFCLVLFCLVLITCLLPACRGKLQTLEIENPRYQALIIKLIPILADLFAFMFVGAQIFTTHAGILASDVEDMSPNWHRKLSIGP